MPKPNTFPFHAEAFLVGTAEMSCEEVGAYIRLLCYQWEKGGLPDDDSALSRLALCDRNAVANIKIKFTRYADGKLRNKRLEKDRRGVQKKREVQSENAKKRWEPYPTQPDSKAIADLFNRRHTTPWSEKELDAFRLIRKGGITLEDIALIARYYAAERAKGDDPKTGGIHRRDLSTFLNNYNGELDRARQWEASKNRKSANLNGNGHSVTVPDGFEDWFRKSFTTGTFETATPETKRSLIAEFRKSL
jgi:uncharacterized protein YdaU (DUF1376 family)